MNIPDTDTQFEEATLREVETDGDGFVLTRDDGMSMWVRSYGYTPEPGQSVRFYGRGLGWPVRGVVVDGKVAFYRTPEEEALRQEEESRAFEKRRQEMLTETKIPDVITPGFEWTEDMIDISGFGGGYERLLRQMISQGCDWWTNHPEADPKFRGFEGVMGLCLEDNEDAEELSKAVTALDNYGATGAMHQMAIMHVFHWRRLRSWTTYQKSMRELARERAAEDAISS